MNAAAWRGRWQLLPLAVLVCYGGVCVCFTIPGGPGDGDAVGGVHVEGQHVVDEAGLLYRRRAAVTLRRRVEVGIERAAVQLHQIQDGGRQLLHHFLCETRSHSGVLQDSQSTCRCKQFQLPLQTQ